MIPRQAAGKDACDAARFSPPRCLPAVLRRTVCDAVTPAAAAPQAGPVWATLLPFLSARSGVATAMAE
jgi:hypothetical protein